MDLLHGNVKTIYFRYLSAAFGSALISSIYGIVDTGFIKKSGHDVEMGENVNNRLGFRGVEDLGSGMKATFELERRFNLNDGTLAQEGKDWDAIRQGKVIKTKVLIETLPVWPTSV